MRGKKYDCIAFTPQKKFQIYKLNSINHSKIICIFAMLKNKKTSVDGQRNQMYSQRNNPYCDLLYYSTQIYALFLK